MRPTRGRRTLLAAMPLNEMMFAGIDQALKDGELFEFGFFPNGVSRYAFNDGDAKDQSPSSFVNYPWIIKDVQEVIPYETGKEMVRQVLKALESPMAAMKR